MRIKSILAAAVLSLSAFSVTVSAAEEPEYTFKLHHMLPPVSMAHSKFLVPWAEKVMKESNGRIKIDIYPAMQLGGKPPALYDQARKGVVDIIWTVAGYTPGRFPNMTVFELPFMPGSAKSTSMALQEYAEKEMQDELKDVHLLAVHTHAPGSFHSRNKLIKTAEDMEGLKVRVPNKVMGEAFSIMKTNGLFLPVTEMASALSKGVLDVAVLPYEVTAPLKIHELAKYHTEISGSPGLYTNTFIFAMNKKAYNSLPDDLKKVIDDNSGIPLAGHIGALFDKYEQVGRDTAVKSGGEFYSLPKDEIARWKAKMQPVTDEWISRMDKRTDGRGQALYDEAYDLIKKYEKQNGEL